VGRGHPRVLKAMKAQMDELMHASDLSSVRRTEWAEKVASVMPPGLRNNCITYFTQSGSGAVETALKFIRTITGRSQIVAFHGAYHGVWTSSGSLTTGEKYHHKGLHIPGVFHVPSPYAYRCPFGSLSQEESEQRRADDVAAVILEPIQGEGGYIAPSAAFLERVKAACVNNGALYVSDEIQAGAGRSGKMWVVEHSTVEPDVLIWGKGMGGDGALLDRVAAVGQETLDYLRAAMATTGLIGEVRGRGLMIGLELVTDRVSKTPLPGELVGRLVGELLQKGVILVPCGRYGSVIRFMPPLTITRALIRHACDRLIECLKALEGDLT